MFAADRDMYLALAKAMDLDFHFATRIIDGQLKAGEGLAKALALKTKTRPALWAAEGKAQERLVAVKVWWAVNKRPGAAPAEPDQPRRPCPGCD